MSDFASLCSRLVERLSFLEEMVADIRHAIDQDREHLMDGITKNFECLERSEKVIKEMVSNLQQEVNRLNLALKQLRDEVNKIHVEAPIVHNSEEFEGFSINELMKRIDKVDNYYCARDVDYQSRFSVILDRITELENECKRLDMAVKHLEGANKVQIDAIVPTANVALFGVLTEFKDVSTKYLVECITAGINSIDGVDLDKNKWEELVRRIEDGKIT